MGREHLNVETCIIRVLEVLQLRMGLVAFTGRSRMKTNSADFLQSWENAPCSTCKAYMVIAHACSLEFIEPSCRVS